MKKITITTAHVGILVIIAMIVGVVLTINCESAVKPKVDEFEAIRCSIISSMDEENISECFSQLKAICEEEEALNGFISEIDEASHQMTYLEATKASTRYMSEFLAYKQMVSGMQFETVPIEQLYSCFGGINSDIAAALIIFFSAVLVVILTCILTNIFYGLDFKILYELDFSSDKVLCTGLKA